MVFVVGARLNWFFYFGELFKWLKDVKFILVDVCKEEIEFRKRYLGLVGDVKKVVDLINKGIKDDFFCLGRNYFWVEVILKKVKDNVLRMEV